MCQDDILQIVMKQTKKKKKKKNTQGKWGQEKEKK